MRITSKPADCITSDRHRTHLHIRSRASYPEQLQSHHPQHVSRRVHPQLARLCQNRSHSTGALLLSMLCTRRRATGLAERIPRCARKFVSPTQLCCTLLLIGYEVIAFRDTLETLVHAVPVVGAVFDTVLPKVLEKAGVPQSISIYAASYCSTSYEASGVATSNCFLHKSAHFNAAAALRIYMAIAYALGAFCSAVSLACLSQRMWNGSDRWRHFALVSTSVATGAVFAASVISSILACAVYMVLSDNLPEPLLFVAIGKI